MKAINLTGHLFGVLTAQNPETKNQKRGWNCLCECGATKWIPTFQLTSGNNKSCGAPHHKQTIKVGHSFGKLTVTEVYKDMKNHRYMAKCVCDCGKTKENVTFKDLQRGTATHCGCSRNTENLGLPAGESCKRALISSYRSNAKHKGLAFELSNEECSVLFEGTCYFCGDPPSEVFTRKGLKGSYTYSSIDRVDSSKGYTLDNVNSCCTSCNFLKGNRTNEDFLNQIKRIAKHHGQHSSNSASRVSGTTLQQEAH